MRGSDGAINSGFIPPATTATTATTTSSKLKPKPRRSGNLQKGQLAEFAWRPCNDFRRHREDVQRFSHMLHMGMENGNHACASSWCGYPLRHHHFPFSRCAVAGHSGRGRRAECQEFRLCGWTHPLTKNAFI